MGVRSKWKGLRGDKAKSDEAPLTSDGRVAGKKGPTEYGSSLKDLPTGWMWPVKSLCVDHNKLWKSLNSWRRFLRVLWTAKISNQSILKEVNPEYSLEGLILKLKLQHLAT